MNHRKILGCLQKFLSGYSLFVYFSIKIRNQVNSIIRYSLNDGNNLSENGELLLIKSLAKNSKIFIDVGANRGYWSLEFFKHANSDTRGVLIEPQVNAIEFIKLNLKNYGDRVDIINSAAGEVSCQIEFWVEPNIGETSSAIKLHSISSAIPTIIHQRTLDDIISSKGINYIDVLKVDAEGFDLHVIKGAIRSLEKGLISVIQFEYNSPWVYAGSTLFEALSIFEKCNYKVHILRSYGLEEFDYSKYGDFYGYSNFVAIHSNNIQVVKNLLITRH